MEELSSFDTYLSGLVITLSRDTNVAEESHKAILAHPVITACDREGNYLPITTEAKDAREIHRWLESLPGVEYVDVVFCSTLPLSNSQSTLSH